MPTPVIVPLLGNANRRLTVSLWLVRIGEAVEAGDRVVELQVPGVTFDVASPCAGTLLACESQPGSEVAEGTVLGWIEPHGVEKSEWDS